MKKKVEQYLKNQEFENFLQTNLMNPQHRREGDAKGNIGRKTLSSAAQRRIFNRGGSEDSAEENRTIVKDRKETKE